MPVPPEDPVNDQAASSNIVQKTAQRKMFTTFKALLDFVNKIHPGALSVSSMRTTNRFTSKDLV
jgi:hypothetical protein